MTAIPAWIGWALLALPCGAVPVCKCGMPSAEGQFARAELAFAGTVLHIAETEYPGYDAPPAVQGGGGTMVLTVHLGVGEQPVTFVVARGWKGAAQSDTVVVRDLGLCSAGFREGGEYLVYATRNERGTLYTSRCDRTRALSASAHDGVDELAMLDSLAARTSP